MARPFAWEPASSGATRATAALLGRLAARPRALLAWLRSPNGVAIDLGTTHTRVARSADEVVRFASVVALRTDARGELSMLAVGNDAKRMLGRTPAAVRAVRPLQGGGLADLKAAERLLRHAIGSAGMRRSPMRPRVAIGVPTGITAVERRALREAAVAAGARQVHLIPSPLAAALGAGLPVADPCGHMIVDIGGGTTEVAVIALSGIVCGASLRVGGDALDQAIRACVRRRFDLVIGDAVSEQIKIAIGRAGPGDELRTLAVNGSDLVTRQLKTVEVGSDDVREALADPLAAILRTVLSVLERVPPELAADLTDTGITLTGGGSLLEGLDVRLAEATGLPVERTPDAYSAVALGCRRCLDAPGLLDEIELV